jgi:hypothetical protein
MKLATFILTGTLAIIFPTTADAKCHGNVFKCPGKNIPHPRITIGNGGGGHSQPNSQPEAAFAVIEPDLTPPADTWCHGKMRVRNSSSSAANIIVTEKWWQVGPRCNVEGETHDQAFSLQGGEGRYLGCSIYSNPSYTCADHKQWSVKN